MSQTTVRVRVRVLGRVQGVFFRDSCRQQARLAGVAGWVRNRRDGSVEAAFEGPRDAVEQTVRWCYQGPAGAQVTSVELHDEDPTGDIGFRVVGSA